MSVYSLMGRATIPNATRRSQLVTAVNTRIAGKQTFGVVVCEQAIVTPEASAIDGVRIEVRFSSVSDRDAALAAALAWLNGNQSYVTKASIRKHTCHHDEIPPGPCTDETVEWVK